MTHFADVCRIAHRGGYTIVSMAETGQHDLVDGYAERFEVALNLVLRSGSAEGARYLVSVAEVLICHIRTTKRVADELPHSNDGKSGETILVRSLEAIRDLKVEGRNSEY